MEAVMVETVLGMTDLQIKLFTALGQLSVAGIVGYIAWQQWRTAQKKLKADLFDRRFSAHRELATSVAQLLESEPQDVFDHVERITRSRYQFGWLFGADIQRLVGQDLTTAVQEFARTSILLLDEDQMEARLELQMKLMTQRRTVSRTLNGITVAMKPYLQLYH